MGMIESSQEHQEFTGFGHQLVCLTEDVERGRLLNELVKWKSIKQEYPPYYTLHFISEEYEVQKE